MDSGTHLLLFIVDNVGRDVVEESTKGQPYFTQKMSGCSPRVVTDDETSYTVMRNEVLLQPLDGRAIQMIGRLKRTLGSIPATEESTDFIEQQEICIV